jgi:high-affinity nickel-transport protein
MLATLSACALGFANGVRHALEPDHLAAVSTFVAGEKSARATVRYAVSWGAGHGAMLVAVGGLLAAFRAELPSLATDDLELVVAFALVALGVRGLRQAASAMRVGETHTHRHGDLEHAHAGPRDHVHVHGSSFARLPFVVGLVHGLAGSGALAALVAAHVSSAAYAIGFAAIYATGAAAGMAALAGLLGVPFARLARSRRAASYVVLVSALASLVVGVVWGAPIVARLAT